MSPEKEANRLLRQGLGYSGGRVISEGETATGNFCAIVCIGVTVGASGIIGGLLGAVAGNLSGLSERFMGHGLTMTGTFSSVTAGAGVGDIFVCIEFPLQ